MNTKWKGIRLGEVIHQEREPIGIFNGNNLPVFGVTNIKGVTQTGIRTSKDLSKYLRLKPGHFVYNPYRVNVGSLGLSSEIQDGIVSPAYVVFSATEHIDSYFLYHFLKSATGDRLINFYGNRGSVRGALRFVDLCQIEISLPPLEKQRQIVEFIEGLTSQINDVVTLRQQASEEAGALVNAVMEKHFDFSGAKESLADYAQIQGGYAFQSTGYTEFGTHQVLRIGNVRDGFLNLSKAPVWWNPANDLRIMNYELAPSDLVISMTGTRNKRDYGFVAKIPHGVRLLLNQRVGRFIVRRRINRNYLYYFLRSPFFRNNLFPSATGTANQANIGNKDIESIPFAPPDNPSEQRQIVAELDVLQTKVGILKNLQDETVIELNNLLPSIIDRAFKDEL